MEETSRLQPKICRLPSNDVYLCLRLAGFHYVDNVNRIEQPNKQTPTETIECDRNTCPHVKPLIPSNTQGARLSSVLTGFTWGQRFQPQTFILRRLRFNQAPFSNSWPARKAYLQYALSRLRGIAAAYYLFLAQSLIYAWHDVCLQHASRGQLSAQLCYENPWILLLDCPSSD